MASNQTQHSPSDSRQRPSYRLAWARLRQNQAAPDQAARQLRSGWGTRLRPGKATGN